MKSERSMLGLACRWCSVVGLALLCSLLSASVSQAQVQTFFVAVPLTLKGEEREAYQECAKHPFQSLSCQPPEPGLGGRHHLYLDPAGLALSCGPHRPACPPRRRLGHVGANRPPSGARRTAHGHRYAAAESGAPPPHRPRQPICQPRLSPSAAGRRHRLQHEPQGQLLGQRTGRKLLRNPQGRGAPTLRIQHPRRGPRQGPAVHLLVQRPPPALNARPSIPCHLRSSNPNHHLRCLTP